MFSRRIGVMDRSEWDALLNRMGRDDYAMRLALDPAVHEAAVDVREKVKSNTPVKTGNLRDSIEDRQIAVADHEVGTTVWYAPIVESRPPVGPAYGRGAMFASNLDYAEERLRHHLDQRIQLLMGP